ncbi:hypothetical protein K493DRAFT_99682 [Basidiobolus meristosporus CBS 931.73]|uniref:Ribosomal protein S2 n=1 Tax=Basidiobolus meristosporus CBS 931.73 TaxID=1314790 RepID=A0A1Y1YS59_9FUNG|nr:hypothetical protein K493DRAFT_99682 [Basidiobolus meristosporus CBS 931.73]|eukprot:ORY00862.1 hypothetical protein K493DRAFT_99682 [Basidiobolus meristosporus CBS 931.73]
MIRNLASSRTYLGHIARVSSLNGARRVAARHFSETAANSSAQETSLSENSTEGYVDVKKRLAELTPEYVMIGSRKAKRTSGSPSEPPSPYSLTISKLLSCGLHLGHSTSLWEPKTLPFVFGTRAGISIINLEHTLTYLRRACAVVREVAYNGGIILFVGTKPEISQITIDAAKRCDAYHVSNKWVPGTITNSGTILRRHAVPDPENPSRPPKTFRPDLLIILNALDNPIAITEADRKNIPTIAIADTDFNPLKVTYPIPANDDSIRGVELIAGVLSMAAKEGQLKRARKLEENAQNNRGRLFRDYRTTEPEVQAIRGQYLKSI